MTGKEYADIIDGFDVEHNSKLLMHATLLCLLAGVRVCGIRWHTINSPSGGL